MKNITVLISTVLLLSAPLTPLANGLEEEKKSQVDSVNESGYYGPTLNYQSQVLYSGPIGGDENIKKISTLEENGDGDFTTQMIINDSANFNWKFDKTIYGSDKLVKNGYSWLTTLVLRGSGAGAGYALTTLFTSAAAKSVAGGMAGAVWVRGVKGLPTTQYTYWTVKKYVDKDAYNIYNRYVVYMYTDKAKTKLKTSFTEVHSNRYK
ncbi:hypothetical protein [Planococcus soli]|uniref:hypothetical protein n=1 Tax=Planococcus soli TaxID=2666072 RepID=UPI00115EAB26|nr:hypothetical protein [Planococcus soli]